MEEKIIFAIPTINFKRLLEQDISGKFKIIIEYGNKQSEILTTSNIARLISQKINDIFFIDPTLSEYHIIYSKDLIEMNEKQVQKENTINKEDKKEEIEEIKEMINYLIQSTREEIIIQPKIQLKFKILLCLLGECKSDNNFCIIETQDEAISFLYTNLHNVAIEYLSQHFLELIDSDKIKNLNDEIMKEIIENYFDFMRKGEEEIKDEQSIKEINEIFNKLKKIEENQIIMHFLICHDFDKYNKEMIEFFYENIDDEIIENEYSRIIFIIKHHLCSLVPKNCETKNDNFIECKFNGDELNGIFNHLRQKLGENLYNNQIVKFSAGGSINGSFPVTNLFKYDKENIDKHFFNYLFANPKGESDSWIEIDLGERKINLASYTIRSCEHTVSNNCKAKSWRIVGSNDHENWDVLNHQTNRSELKEVKSQHIFECENNNQFYRYIRYIQEETWNTNNDHKYLIHYNCIEFFGSIIEP